MNKLQYYIISADDARRLGVAGYREGNQKDGYLVHSGDFACATEDFLLRALPVTETEAVEFVKSLQQ